MKFTLRLSLLFICFSNIASAQSIWSLRQCINYALENNIQIKQAGLNAQNAQLTYDESKYSFLPSANADLSHSYNFGRSVDPSTNIYVTNKQIQANSFSLTSSVTVFNGFQKQNQLAVNHLELEASMADLLKAKNDIAMNITSAYLNVLYTEEQLRAAKKQMETTVLQRQQTERLVAAGNLAELSLKDVDAQLANEELNIVNAANNQRMAILKLLQLLQLPTNYELDVDSTVMQQFTADAFVPTPEMIYDYARTAQPVILAQQYRVAVAKRNVDLRKGSMLPTLSLFGSLRTNYSSAAYQLVAPQQIEKISFNDQLSQNFGKAVGLSLSVPIFNGYQAKTNYKKSTLNLLYTKYTMELTENQLKQEIAQAYANRLAAEAKYKATIKYVESLQAAFEANTKKFNAGVINALEFNTAKNNLSKGQSDLINAKFDYYFKMKIIDFYMGRPLF